MQIDYITKFKMGASGVVIVCKQDLKTIVYEFDFYCVLNHSDLVSYKAKLNK